MARWPVGYFEVMSRWLLNERKNVPARVSVISAEVLRIGTITVAYRAVEREDGSVMKTEERVGFSVTEGSSLARLVQAYIVAGGNPFDISPFWMPNQTEVIGVTDSGEPIQVEKYPYGGLVAPIQSSPVRASEIQEDADGNEVVVDTGMAYLGGGVNFEELAESSRLGTQTPSEDLQVVQVVDNIRGWANQEIKEKLQDIEWRIVKLMDLREQLTFERDEILSRHFGGVLGGLGARPELFNPKTSMQSLIQEMADIIYEIGNQGELVAYRAGPNVDFLTFAYESLRSEILRDAMS